MKVGDYVRTINGIIKISEIKNGVMRDDEDSLHFGDFIKSSPNIIDLIEVGDYINGLPVRFVEENRIDIGQAEDYLWLKNEHIKSIVTKEQFKNIEYEVK